MMPAREPVKSNQSTEPGYFFTPRKGVIFLYWWASNGIVHCCTSLDSLVCAYCAIVCFM